MSPFANIHAPLSVTPKPSPSVQYTHIPHLTQNTQNIVGSFKNFPSSLSLCRDSLPYFILYAFVHHQPKKSAQKPYANTSNNPKTLEEFFPSFETLMAQCAFYEEGGVNLSVPLSFLLHKPFIFSLLYKT